jgi:hypothetical protein
MEIAGAPSLPRCCALAICRRSSPPVAPPCNAASVFIPAPHPGMERSPRFFYHTGIETTDAHESTRIKINSKSVYSTFTNWNSVRTPHKNEDSTVHSICLISFLSLSIRVNPWFQGLVFVPRCALSGWPFFENNSSAAFARCPGLDIMGRTSDTSCLGTAQGDSDAGSSAP